MKSRITIGKFQCFLLQREGENLSWLLLTAAGKGKPGFPRALVCVAITDKIVVLGALCGLEKE